MTSLILSGKPVCGPLLRRAPCRILAAAVVFSAGFAWGDMRAEGIRDSKRMLVAVVGPDWNPSSVKVRETFASSAFRDRFPNTLFGEFVCNEKSKPDDALKRANDWVESLVFLVYRYPAILIYDAKGRSQGRIENIPADLDGAALAKRVQAQIASVEKAVALLDESPGEGLAALQPLVPQLATVGRRGKRQVNWYGDAWRRLLRFDPADRLGWQLRLYMGDGHVEIKRGNALVNSTNETEVAKFESRAEDLLRMNLSVEQKQAVLLGQFARIRHDRTTVARQIELLKRAHALAPRSVWGWAAYNCLADFKVKPPLKWDILSRVDYGRGVLDYTLKPWRKVAPGADDSGAVLSNDMRIVSRALAHPQHLGADERLALVRLSVMTAIGPASLRHVAAREGGRAFAQRFFSDRDWLEDFFASGPVVDPGNSYIALAELVHNDCGWLNGQMGRRVATAMALRYGKIDHLSMVRTYLAYAALARAGRLHRSAYDHGTRDWRLVGFPKPEDVLFLNQLVNLPYASYGGLHRWVPYRSPGLFGEPFWSKRRYYGPWRVCDFPIRERNRQVGGVCVELSDFGAACAAAHGIPSWTCGQPGHRAWIWRRADGKWTISNYIKPPTKISLALFGGGFTGLTTMEAVFADPVAHLNAEYQLWLARFVRREKLGADLEERLLRNALRAQAVFVPAWQDLGRLLIETKASRARIHDFLQAIAKDLHDARWLLWNEIDRQLEALAKREGPSVVREEIRALLPQVRESEVGVREEIDYGLVFDKLVARYAPADNAQWLEFLDLWLENQWGTRYAFRAGISRTSYWAGEDAARMNGFVRTVERLYAKKLPGERPTLDWRNMIARTVKDGDLAAFREAVRLRDRFVPPKQPDAYPAEDFGGRLISHEGMLMPSSSNAKRDAPENYARFIDRTGLGDVRPARFHTNAEKAPWATVMLPGVAELKGVFIDNDNGRESGSQVPLVVWTSEDGKDWEVAWRTDACEKTYRVPLDGVQAKYVRVGREPSERVEPLCLRKVLVYGRPQW